MESENKRKSLTCNSIVFYGSFYEAISALPMENQGRIYNAIMKFAFEGTEEDLDGIELAVFLLVKPQLIANRAKYENGCKGGRPRKQEGTESEPKTNQTESKTAKNYNQIKTEEKPNHNLNETKPKPNENKNENENKNYIKESAERKAAASSRFAPPKIEEVQAYCKERKNGIEAQHFVDYYESNGWRVGKNPMKDWKAAVRTWERNGVQDNRAKVNTAGFEERKYTASDYARVVTDIDSLGDLNVFVRKGG